MELDEVGSYGPEHTGILEAMLYFWFYFSKQWENIGGMGRAGCGEKMGFAFCKAHAFADGEQIGGSQKGCKGTSEKVIAVLLGGNDAVKTERQRPV